MVICLGIESTAHTFASAVIEFNKNDAQFKILSDSRHTYKSPHATGIHPREAARHHAMVSPEILRNTMESSNVNYNDLDFIAFSRGPGLGPCLRVGAVIARSLSSFYMKPLIPVNHALAHVELGIQLTKATDTLVLLVSGGHTMILLFSNSRWRVIGETLDITIGQLFDQFGRFIGYSSPCGDKIEQLALDSSKNYIQLPYSIKGNDVTFSGLLSACKRLRLKNEQKVEDLCFSLQETAFTMVAEVIERSLSATKKKELLIVGGVSANKRISEILRSACTRYNTTFLANPSKYSGDNGVQIAWTGMLEYLAGGYEVSITESSISQSWRLDSVDAKWRN